MVTRWGAFAVVASVAAVSLYACTPGDEISYGAADASDGGEIPDGLTAPPDVAMIDVVQPPSTSLTTPGAVCDNTDTMDSGPTTCDQSAGNGCCFKGGLGAAGECLPTSMATSMCSEEASLFITCTSDDPDNPCCWGKRDTVVFTRRAADCGTGARACDTTNPFCSGTPSCVFCTGQMFGYCPGTGEAPCN